MSAVRVIIVCAAQIDYYFSKSREQRNKASPCASGEFIIIYISTRFVIKDEAGSEILKIENKRICECCEDVDFNVRKALKVAIH